MPEGFGENIRQPSSQWFPEGREAGPIASEPPIQPRGLASEEPGFQGFSQVPQGLNPVYAEGGTAAEAVEGAAGAEAGAAAEGELFEEVVAAF